MKVFNIIAKGNFYDAGQYRFGFEGFRVLADNGEDASLTALNNIEEITEMFRNKRHRSGRRMIRKSETCDIGIVNAGEPKVFYANKEYVFKNVLFEGKFQEINIENLKTEKPELFI